MPNIDTKTLLEVMTRVLDKSRDEAALTPDKIEPIAAVLAEVSKELEKGNLDSIFLAVLNRNPETGEPELKIGITGHSIGMAYVFRAIFAALGKQEDYIQQVLAVMEEETHKELKKHGVQVDEEESLSPETGSVDLSSWTPKSKAH